MIRTVFVAYLLYIVIVNKAQKLIVDSMFLQIKIF